ncbi:hypothetical protein BX600DRAFT_475285 [Xylariales sp. PMI_506]|nr:hypothetical protein BX600DRAFT_475285 [Xylariales sp. PMI_506]
MPVAASPTSPRMRPPGRGSGLGCGLAPPRAPGLGCGLGWGSAPPAMSCRSRPPPPPPLRLSLEYWSPRSLACCRGGPW